MWSEHNLIFKTSQKFESLIYQSLTPSYSNLFLNVSFSVSKLIFPHRIEMLKSLWQRITRMLQQFNVQKSRWHLNTHKFHIYAVWNFLSHFHFLYTSSSKVSTLIWWKIKAYRFQFMVVKTCKKSFWNDTPSTLVFC